MNADAERGDEMKDVERTGGTPEWFDLTVRRGKRLISRCFIVEDPCGFHARPAALLARTAQQYVADVMVGKKGGSTVDGKSIMGLLTIEVLCGNEIEVAAVGDDAAEAVSAIARLFAGAFGRQEQKAIVPCGGQLAPQ